MSSHVPFVHLHVHTTYSFLDGAIKPQDAIARAKEFGMPALAITDHGNMFGAVLFYELARKAEINPILGSEVYVAHGSMADKKPGADHLVLLAETEEGYRNLMFMVSKGYLEGFYRHPKIDKELLASRSAGLIALSACMAGEVPRSYYERGRDAAVRAASELREIFGPDNFFVEIQNTGKSEQLDFNAAARDIAREAGAGIVATNDVHYLDEDDYLAHQVLVCIGTNKQLSQEDRLYREKLDIFLRSGPQMREALPGFPDAIENTLAVASRCKVKIELGKIRLPHYRAPDGFDLEDFLTKLARDGLEQRFRELVQKGRSVDEKSYWQRLEDELGVIKQMGFAGYFLIVQDFIAFARSRGIPVGPGRGSGGGSLAAYALKITDIDPMRYNLLFERFLNPERVSMPDFDIDFCKDRRDEVLHYVIEKYGGDNVAQIATFHQLKSKLVVRDVGRVLGMSYGEVDKIAKMIPAPVQGKTFTIDEAMKQEPKLRNLYKEDERIKLLLDLSRKLEGLTRHAGTHAAGVVIADKPLSTYTPLYQRGGDASSRTEVSTQYDKDVIEKIGLVKFDFLGLKTLTVLETAIGLINRMAEAEGRPPVFQGPGDIPLVDDKVFELISSGDTTGVFQLESRGFRDMLRRLKPKRLEDIIAAVALYRPGPLQSGTTESYIARKNGNEPVTYLHPSLKEVLEETYGVIVYQEQVMQAARLLADFSMAEADNLRRAMGKKKQQEMLRQRELFLGGAIKKGVRRDIAEKIYDQMQEFASYAFNKSHSAGYAIIAYQTAYLKAHYAEEFMAALMTCDEDRIEKVVNYINEGRSKGIRILPPDINKSQMHFNVVKDPDSSSGKAILFGLRGLKGVGGAAIEAILKGREEGPFIDLFDFCARVDLRACNKSNLEQLIRSGAFDAISSKMGLHRGQLYAAMETAMEHGRIRMRDREEGQQDLLGLIAAESTQGPKPSFALMDYPQAEQRTFMQILQDEKSSLGCYVTGHPLEKFKSDISRFATALCGDIMERQADSTVTLVGMIENFKERPTRAGKGKIAFFSLEDLTGRAEVFIPPKVLADLEEGLHDSMDEPVLITGTVEFTDMVETEGGEDRRGRIIMQTFEPLVRARRQRTRQIHFYLQAPSVAEGQIETFRGIISEYRGICSTFLHIRIPGKSEVVIRLPEDYKTDASDKLFDDVQTLFPECAIELR
jgi:DNA polymerase-3 subunit alpha